MREKTQTKIQLRRSGFFANLAPDAFRRWANHYLQCEKSFASPDGFSPVPYFLLCRAIELAIKSVHLEVKGQPEVKDTFQHNIKKAYDHLEDDEKFLTDEELSLLERVSLIYSPKGFEYHHAEDMVTAYSRYPNLNDLRSLASKIVSTITYG